MSEAENGRSGLVFPLDELEEARTKQSLGGAGFSCDDQSWLVRVFQRPDCFGDSGGDSVFKDEFTDHFEYVLPGVVQALEEPGQDRHTRLALLFSFMLGFGPVYSETVRPNERLTKSESDGSWVIPAWVDEFREQARFCAERVDWRKLIQIRDEHDFLFYDVIPLLFPGGVPLGQVVDPDLLDPIQRRGWSSRDFGDPEQLEFWLIWRFRANTERCDIIRLDTLLQAFSEMPEDVLGGKTLGLLNTIGYALEIGSALDNERLNAVGDGWRVVARELIPFLDLLNGKALESEPQGSSLLKAWWRLSVVVYYRKMGGLESDLSAELRGRLVESAAKHMGMLRKTLREKPEVFADKDLTGAAVSDYYKKAFELLCIFAAPWKRLKSLLLAFTEMTVPSVASDLRPWPESEREPPPHPYSQIPLWIGIAMYPQNLQDELKSDPHLQGLREEYAKFCLERLKTKKNDTGPDNCEWHLAHDDFVESRLLWRRCYVQALTMLRVNPGGRAHKTLFWLSKNDPDEMVRELAKKAHRQIRRLDRGKPNLERGASPRRPLFEAFWWLRQAHLLTLGKEIDQAGAMRTRRTELHRTREKDDRLNRET